MWEKRVILSKINTFFYIKENIFFFTFERMRVIQ